MMAASHEPTAAISGMGFEDEVAASARPTRSIWLGALCLALAIHGGALAFALWETRTSEAEESLGAPAIEIGLDLSAPHQEQTDLPPGPEADASVASTASIEQTAKVEPTDLPKEKPTETDDPDRLVAPEATKKPDEQKPTLVESKANPAADSVASEAMAPPSVEAAREAPRSVAPAQGTGQSLQRIRATWQKELVAHLNRFKRYPMTGDRHPGEVVVTFTLDRMGHVVSSRVARGARDPAFDRAALAMMALADPVPPPPPLVADEGLTFSVPVIFRDKK